MSLNHIVLMGAVDRLPEKRVTSEGMTTTSFKLKVVRPAIVRETNGQGGSSPEVVGADVLAVAGRPERFDLVPVFAARRLADTSGDLRAGETVVVEGRLETFALPGEQYRNGVRVYAESLQRLQFGTPAVDINGNTEEPHRTDPTTVAAGRFDDESSQDLDDSIPF